MMMWLSSLNMGGGPVSGGGVVSHIVGFIRNVGTLMGRR